jgi:hypothetical protein
MIIGKGLVAFSFEKYDNNDFIFFASGINSSLNVTIENKEREKKLLLNMPKNKTIIYTSSLFFCDCMKEYKKHKYQMECLIKENFKNYKIFKIGNLIGNYQNYNQFFPAMVKQVREKSVFICNCKKDLIDVEDYTNIVNQLMNVNSNLSLSIGSSYQPCVYEVVETIEKTLNIKTNKKFKKCNKSCNYTINAIIGDSNYFKKVIEKYLC